MDVDNTNPMAPRVYPKAELEEEHLGQRGRWIIPPPKDGWTEVVMGEWELTGVGWDDEHPNSETNYILAGELHVEAGGETVIARAGDTVQVPGGQMGRYWAPTYARMVAFHGPNPAGVQTTVNRHWEVQE